MRTGRPKAMLTISSDERTHLLAITRSRSLPAALTLRAKIVLACEREPSNAVVATRLGVGPHTIGKWRKRFIADRIEGLYDEMRSGRPRTVGDEAVAELITKTLARKPKAATHWSVRAIAKETGITKSTVHRLFQLFGLQPHRTRSFKLSTDPFFVEKLRDVVGLYLNPPDKAGCFASTRRARSRPSNAPSPCFRWGSATSKASPTTTSATARPPCSPPSTCSTARSSPNANPAIAIRSSSPSCVTSRLTCQPSSMSISSSTTTPPTSIPRSELGSHAVRVGTFISRPPTPPGLTRSNASSLSSLNALSVAALSIPPPTSSKKSTASSALTMQIHALSCGPLPLTSSFRNSRDFVSEFPGRNTLVPRAAPSIGRARRCLALTASRDRPHGALLGSPSSYAHRQAGA